LAKKKSDATGIEKRRRRAGPNRPEEKVSQNGVHRKKGGKSRFGFFGDATAGGLKGGGKKILCFGAKKLTLCKKEAGPIPMTKKGAGKREGIGRATRKRSSLSGEEAHPFVC